MGHTIKNLSTKEISPKTIFNNRFVVEVCECVHVHYRNLRIVLPIADFISIAEGMANSLTRWKKQGSPEPSEHTHIELCRKDVAHTKIAGDEIKVNLNTNLYNKNQGRVFAEGADFQDPAYIHLKIRDLRVELSVDEFNQLSEAIMEAHKILNPREVAVG